MSCPKMTKCPIFPEFRNRSALRMLQALYCESDFSRCERYKIAVTGTMPPSDLLPNGERLQVKTPSA